MIWCKVYRTGKDVVLALADKELMDKSFEEGERVLSVGSFYKGELVKAEEAKELADSATIINAVGIRSVNLLVEKGLIAESNAQKIAGISHVQIISII